MPGTGNGGSVGAPTSRPGGRYGRVIIEEESDASSTSESEDGSGASLSSSDGLLSEADETGSALSSSSSSSSSPLESDEPLEVVIPAVTMTARAYQLEMLEESLKRNVIVAVRGFCFLFMGRWVTDV